MTKQTSLKTILLPGLDGTGELFSPFAEALNRQFNIQTEIIPLPVVKDRNGCVAKCTSFEEIAELVISDIQQRVGHGPMNIVLESFAGGLLPHLLPHLDVKKVVLAVSFVGTPHPWLVRLAMLFPLQHALKVPVLKNIIALLCLGIVNNSSGAEGCKIGSQVLIESMRAIPANVLQQRLYAVKSMTVSHQQYQNELLYVRASLDMLVPNQIKKIIELYPNVTCCKLRGMHFLMQARPNICAMHIGHFLLGRANQT